MYETVRPREARPGSGEPLPYAGMPSTVVVDAEKLVDRDGQPLLPTVATETIIFDHGKVYLSNHIKSVCAKLRISLQPRHPPGHAAPRIYPNPFADLPVTLSPAMSRISIRNNSLAALRSAVLVPGAPTRRSAALTLAIPRTTFNAHLRLVEDGAGFAVFDHRKRPVRVTPRGQPLIEEAQRLIALLDVLGQRSQSSATR
ncbi:hypothetical protein OG413_02235 [Streptomyces sp. NBC_01433]|uniref:hypothetical protein n=1 Tax=Streptomyces sp. NBC_01433 TaxID=2903864 RepID=UPI002255194A|nr:hypothetical protein [Streptomyces sp. NBC_01433]MCX4674145.1 hypothetical protein [Streptomyces sp. NBC_01433]